jgi:hypothetical protein
MTKFQKFISYKILYSASKIEQEAVIAFSTIEENGIKKHAREVTDLDNTQLELGGHYIDEYSSYLINEEGYIDQLKEEICVN